MTTLYDRIVSKLNRAHDYLVVDHPTGSIVGIGDYIETLLKVQGAKVLEKIPYAAAGGRRAYLVMKIAMETGFALDMEGLFALLPKEVRLYYYEKTNQSQ